MIDVGFSILGNESEYVLIRACFEMTCSGRNRGRRGSNWSRESFDGHSSIVMSVLGSYRHHVRFLLIRDYDEEEAAVVTESTKMPGKHEVAKNRV